MTVDYNDFAHTFARSREKLKWPEIFYLLDFLSPDTWIIDIACGSWRLIQAYKEHFDSNPHYYYWIDASEKLLQEAYVSYPWFIFLTWNMEKWESYTQIPKIYKNVQKCIFCIAGFHHIINIEDRIRTLWYWYDLLEVWERVYITNWALESPRNINVYKEGLIQNSENEFWSHDFSIKIWKYDRWYHSFTLAELDYLAKASQFRIVKNQLFSTEKNYITILEK